MSRTLTKWSKRLAYVLRHNPASVGLSLDAQGWVEVDTLLKAFRDQNRVFTTSQLAQLVHDCPKQRYALSKDGKRIRANQGHSIDVDLNLVKCAPPSLLFHGTYGAIIPTLKVEGLTRQNRHHVHLSEKRSTAREVGARRGRAVVLEIDCTAMVAKGHSFFRTANGVWLTDAVPPEFIRW